MLLLLAASRCSAAPVPVHTNPLNNDPLVREAFDHFYNLDYPGAVERFQRFHAAHPGDPQPTVLLLEAVVFQELYRLDLREPPSTPTTASLPAATPPKKTPQTRDRILSLADEAVREADWRVSRNSNDVDALYARAWARALECTYLSMVERAYGAGFRLATKAKDDAERVLEIDPNYVDAKLVAGVYQYVVGALPWPFKIIIGFAGITGSKSEGMAMLHDAAAGASSPASRRAPSLLSSCAAKPATKTPSR